VRVVCHDCPANFGGTTRVDGNSVFDPAVIERKMAGQDLEIGGEGWSWNELDLIDEDAGGATRAHRDALKLLAVMLQHTDSKPQQQRLVCLDAERQKDAPCGHPFMMINDVGLTFGQANRFNSNARGSVNLSAWSKIPVWKDANRCIGNLPRSFTGTLENPVISEEGRAFLSRLLMQLSDDQLTSLFEVARVDLRPRTPDSGRSGFPTVSEWVDAFKHSTGHGVGLDIHESPAVGATSADTLAAGHVVTVEPGVYLPEHGGVRIEDTLVVTATGHRRLTNAPKDTALS